MKSFALAFCIGTLAFAAANAQEYSRYSFDLGGGYTVPAGATDDHVNFGWNIRGGMGVNFSSHLGAMLNLGYDSAGISRVTDNELGVTGGGVHIFHATVDPVVHLTPNHHMDVYVTGGGGLFHMEQNFGGSTGTGIGSSIPYFGYYPSSANPSPALASYTVNKPGFDVGAGLAFGAIKHGKFFMEAKWEHMFMSNAHTDLIPVTFGFRW